MDHTSKAVEIFNRSAQQFEEQFMDVSLYAETFDLFCKRIERKGAAILDIACGPGNISRYLLNKRPDFRLLGTDLSPGMIELARQNNPEAEFRLMDTRKLILLNQKFDGIMCGFCLPYLTPEEVKKLFRDVYDLLETKGVFCLSTMEGEQERSGFQRELYIHYYTANNLREWLEDPGFHLIDLRRKSYRAKDGSDTTDLLIMAKSNP